MEDNYALIIVPPKETVDFVDQFRSKYAQFTSYVIPPHLTICPPFFLKDVDEEGLKNILQEGFKSTQHTDVDLNSVGYFEGKNNVAFLNPDDKSREYIKELLTKAQRVLAGHIGNVYEDYNFTPEKYHPHMTIAERVPDEALPQIKDELRGLNINLQFPVSSVQLFRQQKGTTIWERVTNIEF